VATKDHLFFFGDV